MEVMIVIGHLIGIIVIGCIALALIMYRLFFNFWRIANRYPEQAMWWFQNRKEWYIDPFPHFHSEPLPPMAVYENGFGPFAFYGYDPNYVFYVYCRYAGQGYIEAKQYFMQWYKQGFPEITLEESK